MDILFRNKSLRKSCTERRHMLKKWGEKRAKIMQRRLDDLAAANSLEIMRTFPGRCHELGGNRAGQLSIDLDGPFRLLFEPANDPLPVKADGGLDWSGVTAVRILGVEDTHE
ncbi:MAG: type II toxin-antitoxin system RelE/ParE family toxin [Alphaproteobacteria bacterium]